MISQKQKAGREEKAFNAHGARAEKAFHRGAVDTLYLHVLRRVSQIHNAMQAHTWEKLSLLLSHFEKKQSFPQPVLLNTQ